MATANCDDVSVSISQPRLPVGEITYPFKIEPQIADGRGVEVAPGVYWLRMPLPQPLAFINVWALEDEDGWTIVDTGLDTDETVQAWHLKTHPKQLKSVIATHFHADHSGLVGRLCEQGANLRMTEREYASVALEVAEASGAMPIQMKRFFHSAGWNATDIAKFRSQTFLISHYRALPQRYRRLRDGEQLQIGGRAWHVIVGGGHSPESASLYCPALALLISGDQVLPKISSNVSVLARDPEANPLDDWLVSLHRLRVVVPDEVLVLPAHKAPFYGLHARIEALLRSHTANLIQLRERLRKPRRAVDVFDLLFKSNIDSYVMKPATGEAIAHLNWLCRCGKAARTTDQHGVHWWQAIAE